MKAWNPATEELIREYPEPTGSEVEARLDTAERTFATWRKVPYAERSRRMHAAADRLRGERAAYARLMTEEMGKTLTAAEAEVDKCAWVCDWYADHAEELLAFRPAATDASHSGVRYDPLGPVLAVMPWNFPFWQVFRFAAPALMAGNVGLLKHASNVPGTALAIEEVFRAAGFPEGAFTTLLLPSSRTLELIAHPAVRAVTLTGSDGAGRQVAAEAGRQLKKTVLELGGSDPFIVLADADPVDAAAQAARARTINNGQSCIAAKRFIVDTAVAAAFEDEFVRQMESLRVGDPMDRATDVGPMARADLLDDLDAQVRRSVDAGAVLRTGGRRLEGKGWYYPPTVLTGVTPGMAVFDEETFGPVAAVIRAEGTEDAGFPEETYRAADGSLAGFLAWIAGKDPDFHAPTRLPKTR